jgi:Tfp pilus assembly pilus retraction ATPase PilT
VRDDRARGHIDALLRLLVARGGSDLHLRCGQPPVLRTSGELVRVEEPALGADALEAMLVSIMPERKPRRVLRGERHRLRVRDRRRRALPRERAA